ncbi:prolyl oligopeptidase family serine peptidase [Alphaproteobacteria bacterium]|nr:prolyl oligopeptidase family serine peptidase [Alphaproteobacteria bacterium]
MSNTKNNIYRRPPAAGGISNKLVVFLHGYGADGKDLIDLANPFSMAMPNATFISPDAPHPCTMSPSGREWFPIDQIPTGAIKASENLISLIQDEAKSLNLSFKDVILIGFSQGAMMSLQCLLINNQQFSAIIGYSGALREENVEAAHNQIINGKHNFANTPVLLIHGEKDEVVPFQSLISSKNLLNNIGFNIQTLSRPNLGHGIDPEGISAGMELLKTIN